MLAGHRYYRPLYSVLTVRSVYYSGYLRLYNFTGFIIGAGKSLGPCYYPLIGHLAVTARNNTAPG